MASFSHSPSIDLPPIGGLGMLPNIPPSEGDSDSGRVAVRFELQLPGRPQSNRMALESLLGSEDEAGLQEAFIAFLQTLSKQVAESEADGSGALVPSPSQAQPLQRMQLSDAISQVKIVPSGSSSGVVNSH